MAVVTRDRDNRNRTYRLPTDADYKAVREAREWRSGIVDEWARNGKQGLCPVPDEPLPPIGTLGFRVQRYGMRNWGDLFTARQAVSYALTASIISDCRQTDDSGVVSALLASAVDKVIDFNCALARWRSSSEDIGNLFGRNALPMCWDFSETNIVERSYVGLERSLGHIAKVLSEMSVADNRLGVVQLADARKCPLPDQSASIWFTDPPYYDAIPYADLSDFFVVWLKRFLPNHPMLRDPFDDENPLSPKTREIVQDETKVYNGRPKDRSFFEDAMSSAFAEGRRVLREDGIGAVVFAHKTTEGWEALLSGMIRGGWTVTGSWPIMTESATRQRAFDSAALLTSVHLICRPRADNAPVGEWSEVLRRLPERVESWMERLQGEGVRGADLVFACIGPALEIFSRYRIVETAGGRGVGLGEFLERVWGAVSRTALRQVLGEAEETPQGNAGGALEEDARLTALFLWTLQSAHGARDESEKDESAATEASRKGFALPFDVVRRFSQPMGIDLGRWSGRVIEQKQGRVRLLPVSERSRPLLGPEGAGAAAAWIETDSGANLQPVLFPEPDAPPQRRRRGHGAVSSPAVEARAPDATTLDRVHAAMLLQRGGHANALRALIRAEQDRGPEFLRLANALSALYPRGSDEKRLLDGMLLAVPG